MQDFSRIFQNASRLLGKSIQESLKQGWTLLYDACVETQSNIKKTI